MGFSEWSAADLQQVLGRTAGRLCEALEGGELDRLRPRDVTAGPVADDDLERRCDRRGGERHSERRSLVATAASV